MMMRNISDVKQTRNAKCAGPDFPTLMQVYPRHHHLGLRARFVGLKRT